MRDLLEDVGVSEIQETSNQLLGVCPVCGKRKFYCNPKSEQWDCKVCGTSGNRSTIAAWYAERCAKNPPLSDMRRLRDSRGLSLKTFEAFDVGFDSDLCVFTVPQRRFNDGKIISVRQYLPASKFTSASISALRGFKSGLFLPKSFDSSANIIAVCEGEWDAMALYESRVPDDVSVVGSPGAGAFPKDQLSLFQDKEVFLLFDHDVAGYKGMHRLREKLSGVARHVRCIIWPSSCVVGYDVRDQYRVSKKDLWKYLVSLCDGVEVLEKKSAHLPAKIINPFDVFKKWMFLPDASCLDVVYGTCIANRMQGDPIWMLLVAPPGGMKTELLLSLSGHDSIIETTSLTPQALMSGANFGGSDPSLIPKLNGKILVIKDFTTIISMNSIQRDEILGVLRDAYDGSTEKRFGNGIVRRYESKFGILAGVTPVIESLGTSGAVLGERFLRYRMITSGKHVRSNRARILKAMSNIKANDAMRAELREASNYVLAQSYDMCSLSSQDENTIASLAQWTACLRGVVHRDKYSKEVLFNPMIEVGTRLAKQLCKIAYGISAFHKDDHVTNRTFSILIDIAKSTIPERVENIVRQLFVRCDSWKSTVEVKNLLGVCSLPDSTLRGLLHDLHLLGVLRREGYANHSMWGFSRSIFELMSELNLYDQERMWQTKKEKR